MQRDLLEGKKVVIAYVGCHFRRDGRFRQVIEMQMLTNISGRKIDQSIIHKRIIKMLHVWLILVSILSGED